VAKAGLKVGERGPEQVVKAAYGLGINPEMAAELMGGMARRTGSAEQMNNFERLSGLFAIGTAEGLAKARVPELLQGLHEMSEQQARVTGKGGVAGAFANILANMHKQGTDVRYAMPWLQTAAESIRGGQGGPGEQFLMRTHGFGMGTDYFSARLAMQKGGPGALRKVINRAQAEYGGYGKQNAEGTSLSSGALLALESVLKLQLPGVIRLVRGVKGGKMSDADIKKMMKDSKPLEDEFGSAYDVRIKKWMESLAQWNEDLVKSGSLLTDFNKTVRDIIKDIEGIGNKLARWIGIAIGSETLKKLGGEYTGPLQSHVERLRETHTQRRERVADLYDKIANTSGMPVKTGTAGVMRDPVIQAAAEAARGLRAGRRHKSTADRAMALPSPTMKDVFGPAWRRQRMQQLNMEELHAYLKVQRQEGRKLEKSMENALANSVLSGRNFAVQNLKRNNKLPSKREVQNILISRAQGAGLSPAITALIIDAIKKSDQSRADQ